MKCPNCHKEVEKGSLYCPHCLSEIPWVREFDSVETQLRKKEQQDSGEESDREGLSAGKFIYNRKRTIVTGSYILFRHYTVMPASSLNRSSMGQRPDL